MSSNIELMPEVEPRQLQEVTERVDGAHHVQLLFDSKDEKLIISVIPTDSDAIPFSIIANPEEAISVFDHPYSYISRAIPLVETGTGQGLS